MENLLKKEIQKVPTLRTDSVLLFRIAWEGVVEGSNSLAVAMRTIPSLLCLEQEVPPPNLFGKYRENSLIFHSPLTISQCGGRWTKWRWLADSELLRFTNVTIQRKAVPPARKNVQQHRGCRHDGKPPTLILLPDEKTPLWSIIPGIVPVWKTGCASKYIYFTR